MVLPINQIICGDCLEVMKAWPENCIDTIITDPPYALGFMGKDWDTFDKSQFGIAGEEGENDLKVKKNFKILPRLENWQGYYELMLIAAKELLRIAKPGAIMLCFGGTRTYHRLTCAIEDAGWQIRDCIMWLYGSGFPKSYNVGQALQKKLTTGRCRRPDRDLGNLTRNRWSGSEEGKLFANTGGQIEYTKDLAKFWNGWGTALKPAYEPIVVAMKPLDGTFAENAEKWGVAGLNIDGGRIPAEQGEYDIRHYTNEDCFQNKTPKKSKFQVKPQPSGRWPANIILDEAAAEILDEQSGELHSNSGDLIPMPGEREGNVYHRFNMKSNRGRTDSGGASRFFYVAKASRGERNEFLEGAKPDKLTKADNRKTRAGIIRDNRGARSDVNFHPTVKPLKLMEYLCKLTKTPTGGVVLDCFGGSGTTAIACINTGRDYILIEKDPEYCELAKRRITGGGLFESEIVNHKS